MYEFQQPKEAGYRWIEARHVDLIRQANNQPSERNTWVLGPTTDEVSRYDPMKRPKLYTRFAALASSNESADARRRISSFAEQNGRLGLFSSVFSDANETMVRELTLLQTQYSYTVVAHEQYEKWGFLFECLDDWLFHATLMRDALALLAVAKKEQRLSIETLVTVDRDMIVYQLAGTTPKGRFGAGIPRETADDYVNDAARKRDWPVLARVVLEHVINAQLRVHTEYGIKPIGATGDYTHLVLPRSLLGALWLQLSHELTGDERYRECRYCGKWFSVTYSKEGLKSSAKYCRAECKNGYNNARQPKTRAERAAKSAAAKANRERPTVEDPIPPDASPS